MHSVAFLQDLAVVMLAAGVVTVLFHGWKQPVVLGYILAGFVIGPHVLPMPLITSLESVQTLAELGVVFLLFALGLEFNLRKIGQIGPTAFIVAPLETALMFFAGFMIGRLFGWPTTDSVYLGAILMISSTTIIAKTLAEMGKNREPFAQAIFGILIVEDIIAVLVMASLSGASGEGGFSLGALVGLGLRLSEFVVVALVLGLLVVPRLLRHVGKFRGDETLLVAVLGLCFGMSLLASKLGFSVALGAFIMGALIAESELIHRIERIVAPLRDLFSAVFFVAIGMLIDPGLLWQHRGAVGVIAATLILGKVVACSFGSFLAGYDRGTALRIGLGLGQIGEFSFIIAGLGVTKGVTSEFLYPIAVGVSAITTVLTPYFIRHAHRVVAVHDRWAPKWLVDYQRDYVEWIRALRGRRTEDRVRPIVRKMLLQLAINVALIAAFFLGALFLAQSEVPLLGRVPRWLGGANTVIWLGALLLSLPIMVAFVRKLQALGMLLSELAIRETHRQRQRVALRALLSNTILFAGSAGIGLVVLALSAPVLPPWEVIAVLCGFGGVMAFLFRAQFIHLYARAQNVIQETLHRPPEERIREVPELPPLLQEASLRTIRLPMDLVHGGRSLRELQLRTRYNVSVIAIRRGARTIHNPDAEEQLEAGDELLLLGEGPNLELGAAFLQGHGVG